MCLEAVYVFKLKATQHTAHLFFISFCVSTTKTNSFGSLLQTDTVIPTQTLCVGFAW